MCGQGLMLGPGLAQDVVGLMLNGKPVTEETAFRSLSLYRDFGRTEALK
jgi:glycine/D-amino acid oxidase-like deaminating enzyme